MNEIHTDKIITSGLEMRSPSGALIRISCEEGYPRLSFVDSAGLERLVLSLDDQEEPQIGLLDRNGAVLIGFGVNAELGEAGFNVFSRDGKTFFVLTMRDGKVEVHKNEAP